VINKFERVSAEETAFVTDVNERLEGTAKANAFSVVLPSGDREWRLTLSAGGRRRTFKSPHPFHRESPAAFVKLAHQWVSGSNDLYSTDEKYAEEEADQGIQVI
jgi:hypothetical protein